MSYTLPTPWVFLWQMSPCFLQHSTLPSPNQVFQCFKPWGQCVVWHARTPHNVWVFNIDHLAHKREIVHIVDHNLYNIGKPCIYMDCLMWPWIHVVVMAVQSKFVDALIQVKKIVPSQEKRSMLTIFCFFISL